jgi:hypothetical protein
MPACVSASYLTDVCPISGPNTCISWQSGDVPCLNICNGMPISSAELIFANNICALLNTTDLSNITIPTCLQTVWNIGQEDKTIFTLVNFLLEQECVLQAQITALQTPTEPNVTVDFKCCSQNPCVTNGTVSLTTAFENIITCLCQLFTNISTLQDQINVLQNNLASLTDATTNTSNAGSLASQLILQQTSLSTLTSLFNTLEDRVNCLNAQGGNLCN